MNQQDNIRARTRVRRALARYPFFSSVPARRIGYFAFLLVLLEVTLRVGGAFVLLTRTMGHTVDPNEGKFVVLAVGESTTFGLGVDPKNAYPSQLQTLLNENSDQDFVVINTGIPGQTSTSILRSLAYQLHKYQPRIVLLHFGANDMNEALNSLSSRVVFGINVPDSIAGLRIYRLACILRDYLLYAPKVGQDGQWTFFDPAQRTAAGGWIQNPFYLDQLEQNYRDVIGIVRSNHAIPLVLSYMRVESPTRKLLEKVAAETKAPYVELHSRDTDRNEFFTQDFWHPNERGHRFMAETIFSVLRREKLI